MEVHHHAQDRSHELLAAPKERLRRELRAVLNLKP